MSASRNLSSRQFEGTSGRKYIVNSKGDITHFQGMPVKGMTIYHTTNRESADSILRGEIRGRIYGFERPHNDYGPVLLKATLPHNVKLKYGSDAYSKSDSAHGFIGDGKYDAEIDGDIIINQERTPLKWEEVSDDTERWEKGWRP